MDIIEGITYFNETARGRMNPDRDVGYIKIIALRKSKVIVGCQCIGEGQTVTHSLTHA